jgi:UDP-2,3-diacylglucosamine pyrophosphatase LpxH
MFLAHTSFAILTATFSVQPSLMGDTLYYVILRINHFSNTLRHKYGFHYWSFSSYIKNSIKNVVKYVENFEELMAREAKRKKCDGVICGHIHHAEMRMIHGILYMNDGDWVESCTALVEHQDGRFELLDWSHREAIVMGKPLPMPAPDLMAEVLRGVQ